MDLLLYSSLNRTGTLWRPIRMTFRTRPLRSDSVPCQNVRSAVGLLRLLALVVCQWVCSVM